MSAPALELRDLSVRFPSEPGRPSSVVTAADRVGLAVEEASFTALVGESGSGKSVTALAICRLLQGGFISGEAWYRDAAGRRADLLKMDEEGLLSIRGKEISYVFQDPASFLNPVMRVGEQIIESCLAHFREGRIQAKTKALEILKSLRISDAERVYRSFPHELSGGLCQRAMLAAALIAEPRVLIADEPTTALDAPAERETMELLTGIQKKRGLMLIFITHDLSLAERYSDSIYVMDKGRVIERLEKKNGFSATHPYSRRLFNASLAGAIPKTLIEV